MFNKARHQQSVNNYNTLIFQFELECFNVNSALSPKNLKMKMHIKFIIIF